MKRIISLLIFFYLTLPCFGQAEGSIADENNKAITTVLLTAVDSAGKVIDTVRTDERGFYFFKKLKPGKYNIEAKAPGFAVEIQTIKINPPPANSNENDDTYYAEVLNMILKRPKPGK